MKKVTLYILLTAFLFGTMEVALKLVGDSLDPLQLTFLRFFTGGLILIPMAVVESRKSGYRPGSRDIAWMTILGIMCIPVSMLCFQLGLLRCNAATAAALICINPLYTMVIAHLFTAEKMDRLKTIAFCIGLVAAFFMIRPWDVQEGNTPLGMILMIIAGVTLASYTVMGKRSIARIGTFTQTSISFILGSLVLMIIMIIQGRPVFAGVMDNLPAVIYCGVFVTGLGYMFYFLAIRASDATTGSLAFFIKPAIAPFLAIFILHETVCWNTIVGIVLLITASALTLRDTFARMRSRSR